MASALILYRPSNWLRRLGEAAEAFMAWLSPPKPVAKAHVSTPVDEAPTYRQIAFTFAVIALSAKLARGEGELKRDAFIAFREAFPLEDEESAKIRELFRLAWEDGTSAETVARQVAYLYPKQPELWREMLSLLVSVALADGPLTPSELRMLSAIGSVFGYGRAQMSRLISSASDRKRVDPFRVLGLKRGAAQDEVKERYRSLMRRYHPDAVASRLHYPEALAVAHQRSAMISEAYKALAG